PDFAFAGGEQLLRAVPPTMNGYDLKQRHVGRRVRQRVPRLRLPIRGANDDEPFARTDAAVLISGLHPRFRGPHHLWSFGPGAAADLAPPLPGQRLRPGVRPPPRRPALARGGRLLQVTDQRVARHVQHVTPATPAQSGPKRGTAPKLVVARHPATGQGGSTAVQQGQADPPTLLEHDSFRHVRLLATRAIV